MMSALITHMRHDKYCDMCGCALRKLLLLCDCLVHIRIDTCHMSLLRITNALSVRLRFMIHIENALLSPLSIYLFCGDKIRMRNETDNMLMLSLA